MSTVVDTMYERVKVTFVKHFKLHDPCSKTYSSISVFFILEDTVAMHHEDQLRQIISCSVSAQLSKLCVTSLAFTFFSQ